MTGGPPRGGAVAGPRITTTSTTPTDETTGAQEMTRTLSARFSFVASLRLVGVTVVLAAGIAGFATVDSGSSAAPVPLDLAVVTTHAGS